MPSPMLKIARAAFHVLPFRNVKNRVIDRTFIRHVPFREHELDIRTRDGFVIRVDPRDMLGRHLYLMGEFEQGVCDLLHDVAQPGDVLWDIGANIGLMSCSFLHRVPRSKVLAVEPLPDIHDRLAHNLSQFDQARVVRLRCAVSDRHGQAVLQRVEGHLGASGIVEHADTSKPHAVAELKTGADLEAAQPWSGVNVVKIDVEGHEEAVLRGIRESIQRHRPRAIVFEHLAPTRTLPKALVEFFQGSVLGSASSFVDRGLDYALYNIARTRTRSVLIPIDRAVGKRAGGLIFTDDFVAFPREQLDSLRSSLSGWWR